MAATTWTTRVQVLAGATLPPVALSAVALATGANTSAPQPVLELAGDVATTSPAGKLSAMARPVIALAPGLNTVIANCEVCKVLTALGVKLLAIG